MAERPREAWAQLGIISSFSILNAERRHLFFSPVLMHQYHGSHVLYWCISHQHGIVIGMLDLASSKQGTKSEA